MSQRADSQLHHHVDSTGTAVTGAKGTTRPRLAPFRDLHPPHERRLPVIRENGRVRLYVRVRHRYWEL